MSKQYGARRLLSELPGLKTWKHRQSAKENPQDGYKINVRKPGRSRPRYSVCSNGGPRAQSGVQAKKTPITS